MIDRVRSLATNTRKRGVSYLGAVSAYQAHALRYRMFAGHLGAVSAVKLAPIPEFYFGANDVRTLTDSISEQVKQRTIVEADKILEQKFCFRGLPEAQFLVGIDWNFAPGGNLSWSWDLNRHAYFLNLGTAYHYSQDGKYVEKLEALWDDWILRNPAGKGSNWSAPFEVAARLRNWIWAYFLLAASAPANPRFLLRAWNGLCDHAEFLADHLEYHWPNNHLLLECLSLCEFALIFREFGGEKYLQRSAKVLAQQVEQQILADGVHAELCPMYHEIVAGELRAFAHLCTQLHYELPAAMKERIQATRGFSSTLRRRDGSFPLLGDSSSPDTCLRFDPTSAASGDLAYWIKTDERLDEPSTPSELALHLFDEAGYAILRGGAHQSHLIFDFGPWSRCATTNHGHSDALSFELHASERPWIVDSGFFYPWGTNLAEIPETDDQTWTSYFRGTSAHNTVRLNDKEQSEIGEHGDLKRSAKTTLVGYRSSPEEIAACGEVRPYWSDGEIVHRREISLNQNGEVTVKDLFPRSPHAKPLSRNIQSFLHFAPDLSVELSSHNAIVAHDSNQMLTCQVHSLGIEPRLRLLRGQESPRQGWVALSSSTVAPAWVLLVEGETLLPCEIRFSFLIGPHTKFASRELENIRKP